MADTKNGAAKPAPPANQPTQDAVVDRVVVSPKGAPVTETALVLSDALLAQLVIKGPLPHAK